MNRTPIFTPQLFENVLKAWAALGLLASATGHADPLVATGALHTCAVAQSKLYCWGSNEFGQLQTEPKGQCTFSNPYLIPEYSTGSPKEVPCSRQAAVASMYGFPEAASITALAAGTSHTCAIANGGAFCWGSNTVGQLGDAMRSGPGDFRARKVQGLESGVTHIAAWDNTTCAIANRKLHCWGANWFTTEPAGNDPCLRHGQGGRTRACRSIPAAVPELPQESPVRELSLGHQRICVVLENGSAHCRGYEAAARFTRLAASGATSLAPGFPTGYAVIDGRVWLWETHFGLPGPDGPKAVPAIGLPQGIKALKVVANSGEQSNSACALLENGTVMCWGLSFHGALGTGVKLQPSQDAFVPPERAHPAKVKNLGDSGKVSDLFGAYGHVCAIEDDALYCWGFNAASQLGDGFALDGLVPTEVTGLPERLSQPNPSKK